jgi:hypothetical protein
LRIRVKKVLIFAIGGASLAACQDLTPRAYLITPVNSNAVTFSYGYNTGKLTFDPSVPIDNAKGSFGLETVSYYHAYSLFGRSSNIVATLPYAVGTFSGDVVGSHTEVYRSGMVDARIRFALNLKGGPAMKEGEFRKWRERNLIGVSLIPVIPTGQYDPARVINPGTNRWAFKPDIGYTRRRGHWVGEGSSGVWFFGPNSMFFPGNARRTQLPMVAMEGHLGYYPKPGLWASFDGNFWAGGRSTVNGIEKNDQQTASRLGFTVSLPMARNQSVKFSVSRGAYIAIGGNYTTIFAGWQYSWIGTKMN